MSHDHVLCLSVCMCLFIAEMLWRLAVVPNIFNCLYPCMYVPQHASLQATETATVHFQLHSSRVCVVGNENSKPAGGCPALYQSEQLSDNLVVEPSPCTACSLFMYRFGIYCCTLVCLTSLWTSAEVYVSCHVWQQRWGACMIAIMSHPPPLSMLSCVLQHAVVLETHIYVYVSSVPRECCSCCILYALALSCLELRK